MKEKDVTTATAMIERILTHGVNLGDVTKQEQENYLLDLCQFINQDKVFKAVIQAEKVIIESYNWDPILAISAYKGTLYLKPLSESNFFESFMLVLGFISAKDSIREFIDELDMEEDMLTPEREDEPDEFDWI
jgi:hypothetical protein